MGKQRHQFRRALITRCATYANFSAAQSRGPHAGVNLIAAYYTIRTLTDTLDTVYSREVAHAAITNPSLSEIRQVFSQLKHSFFCITAFRIYLDK